MSDSITASLTTSQDPNSPSEITKDISADESHDPITNQVLNTVKEKALETMASPGPEKKTLEIIFSNTLLDHATTERSEVEKEIIKKTAQFRSQSMLFIFLLAGAGATWHFSISKTLLWILSIIAALSLFAVINFRGELKDFKTRKQTLETRITELGKSQVKQGQEHKYFDDLVAINISNLGSHYSMVTQQVRLSYWMSSSAGLLGFALIAAALAIGYVAKSAEALSYIVVGAGVLVEFIAAVFFYLYNKNVRQLKDYHDSLLRVQNVLLSLKMVDSVQDSATRTQMIRTVIESIVSKPIQ